MAEKYEIKTSKAETYRHRLEFHRDGECVDIVEVDDLRAPWVAEAMVRFMAVGVTQWEWMMDIDRGDPAASIYTELLGRVQ